MPDAATRHDHASEAHRVAARRHEQAARYWFENGDPERAELERRNAEIEHQAADLEADRARVQRERPIGANRQVSSRPPVRPIAGSVRQRRQPEG